MREGQLAQVVCSYPAPVAGLCMCTVSGWLANLLVCTCAVVRVGGVSEVKLQCIMCVGV